MPTPHVSVVMFIARVWCAVAEWEHQCRGLSQTKIQGAARSGSDATKPVGRCGDSVREAACLHHLAGPICHPAVHRVLCLCRHGPDPTGVALCHGLWPLLDGIPLHHLVKGWIMPLRENSCRMLLLDILGRKSHRAEAITCALLACTLFACSAAKLAVAVKL